MLKYDWLVYESLHTHEYSIIYHEYPYVYIFPSVQECGIESLVEELCVKLKKVQEEREKKHSNIGGGGGGGTNHSSASQSDSPGEKHSNTDSSEGTPVSQAERLVYVIHLNVNSSPQKKDCYLVLHNLKWEGDLNVKVVKKQILDLTAGLFDLNQ